MTRYHVAFNWKWRPARLTRCDHAKWEWFGTCGPLRVIKMRKDAKQ